jgi:hypothetical protein
MTSARGGVVDKQQTPFFRDPRADAGSLGIADRQMARLSLAVDPWRPGGALLERVYPGLVWMALHFAEAKVNWLTTTSATR